MSPVDATTIEPGSTAPGLRCLDLALAGAVFAVSLIVYIASLAPTVTGEDSGELIAAAYLGGVAHPPGYPLWCLVTRPFFAIPVGDIAWRANLVSAFWGSVTVAAVFLLARRMGAGRLGSWAGALALAFSQRFWSQAVITEVYTLNCALLAFVLHAALSCRQAGSQVDQKGGSRARGRLALLLLGLVFGLSTANHYMLMLLASPGVLVLLIPARKWLAEEWRYLLGSACLALLGALVYVYLPIAASRGTFMNWGELVSLQDVWDHILRTDYRHLEFAHTVTPGTKVLFLGHAAGELWKQFTPWLLPLAAIGLLRLWRTDQPWLAASATISLCNTVVLILLLQFTFEGENRQRVELYYLPSYLMVSLWVALGGEQALRAMRAWSAASDGGRETPQPGAPRLWGTTAALLLALAPLLPLVAHLGENDRSDSWIARDYADSILRTAEADAVLFPSADFTTFPLIYLMGVEQRRPDALLADKYGMLTDEAYELCYSLAPRLRPGPEDPTPPPKELVIHTIAATSPRPVYTTDRAVVGPSPGIRIEPWGLLYRLIPEGSTLPPAPWHEVRVRGLDRSGASSHNMERGLAGAYYRMRAEAFLATGNTMEGLEQLERAAETLRTDHRALNNLGSVAAEHGQDTLARELFRRALAVWPVYATPLINLAEMALSEGRIEAAMDYHGEALAVDPRDRALERLGTRIAAEADARARREGPLTDWLEQARLHPDDPVVHNNLGTAFAEAGHLSDAVQHWHRSLELDPDYAMPHLNLATAYEHELRDPERAAFHRAEFERLSRAVPRHDAGEAPHPPPPGAPEVLLRSQR